MDTFLEALNLVDESNFSEACVLFKELLEDNNYVSNQTIRDSLLLNISTCLAKVDKIEEALKFLEQIKDQKPKDVQFNKILCHYKHGSYEKASELIKNLLDDILKEYPELTSSDDVLSQNKDSIIFDALNLQLAILYELNEESNQTISWLSRLVNKSNECNSKIDFMTKNNIAICNKDINIAKNNLTDLVNSNQSTKIPQEVLRNLFLLKIETGYNVEAQKLLPMLKESLDEGTFQLFEIVSQDNLRFLDLLLKRLEKLLDQLLSTAQVKKDLIYITSSYAISFYWEINDFTSVERVLMKLEKILSKHDYFLLRNMANTSFMIDTKFQQASQLYERLLHKGPENDKDGLNDGLLSLDAMDLGNLCVSYVLTGQNAEAEALIKEVEAEEYAISSPNNDSIATMILNSSSAINNVNKLDDYVYSLYQNNTSSTKNMATSHSCTINMIIGTLYCVKNNYQFGLTRIFKSLDPIKEKLTHETWSHAKRCILSLLDRHCKQMMWVDDYLFDKVVDFLIQCEQYGLLIQSDGSSDGLDIEKSVTYEARYLRAILLTIIHDR